MKLISDAYLYRQSEYNKRIFEYLMTAERIDKSSDVFSDVIYSVKKLASPILLKVLLSDKIVLVTDDAKGGMSRAFKVMYVKDVKSHNRDKKVFIDCTGIIKNTNGVYTCSKTSSLIAYLMTAMTYIIYYNNPKAIVSNNTIVTTGANIFVDLSLYVLSYLKMPITYMDNKERMSFVIAEYFMYCVMGTKSDEIIYNTAKKISGITEKKTCDYLHALFSYTFDEGTADIEKFIKKFAEVFLDQHDGDVPSKTRIMLTVEAFTHRWMYAYGAGTFLGIECFVPFSAIVTDCYSGAYINQQNTIEKIGSSKMIVKFSNELLKIGGENA